MQNQRCNNILHCHGVKAAGGVGGHSGENNANKRLPIPITLISTTMMMMLLVKFDSVYCGISIIGLLFSEGTTFSATPEARLGLVGSVDYNKRFKTHETQEKSDPM